MRIADRIFKEHQQNSLIKFITYNLESNSVTRLFNVAIVFR